MNEYMLLCSIFVNLVFKKILEINHSFINFKMQKQIIFPYLLDLF